MNRPNTALPSTTNPSKVQPEHLNRWAYVYVRQSTPKQVTHNQESQMLQIQLSQRAESLGWQAARIRIVDNDQGLSGTSSVGRDGFQELVAEISLGHVGIVFGYQVSRLALNNSDWYHLLDLAAVFDTLIADMDGVYDLRLYNDRLLLGLKGTMSEAELHLLRQRLDAGRLNQVYRGAYRQNLPTGLVRLEDGSVTKDPNDQVRHTLELVFRLFSELHSSGKVMRYLNQHQILLPRQQSAGPHKGQMVWKRATDSAVYEILRNPAYAGAFVYGRKQVDRRKTIQEQGKPGRSKRPMSEWLHIQQEAYPAYISWQEFLANQNQIQQNRQAMETLFQQARGAVREGGAVLQGLLVCGICGHRMHVHYRPYHSYQCCSLFKHNGEPNCMSVAGQALDNAVTQAFFAALQPAQIDILEAILAQQNSEREQLVKHWQHRLKQAHYDAHLAARQYEAVDPQNRLVASELERRWEAKLQVLREVQEAYERFQCTPVAAPLTAQQRAQFQHISAALPAVWPTLTYEQQKLLLRNLIAHVICKRQNAGQIELTVVWVSGHYSVIYAQEPLQRQADLPDYAKIVERTEALWRQGLTDHEIASQLTAEGFHSARRSNVPPAMVQRIRLQRGWHLTLARGRNADQVDGYLTAKGLSNLLGIPTRAVYRMIYKRLIDPAYVQHAAQNRLYLISNDPVIIAHLQDRVGKKPHDSRVSS